MTWCLVITFGLSLNCIKLFGTPWLIVVESSGIRIADLEKVSKVAHCTILLAFDVV